MNLAIHCQAKNVCRNGPGEHDGTITSPASRIIVGIRELPNNWSRRDVQRAIEPHTALGHHFRLCKYGSPIAFPVAIAILKAKKVRKHANDIQRPIGFLAV